MYARLKIAKTRIVRLDKRKDRYKVRKALRLGRRPSQPALPGKVVSRKGMRLLESN